MPSVNETSSNNCVCLFHPAFSIAGVINLVQMSRSDNFFLFTILFYKCFKSTEIVFLWLYGPAELHSFTNPFYFYLLTLVPGIPEFYSPYLSSKVIKNKLKDKTIIKNT